MRDIFSGPPLKWIFGLALLLLAAAAVLFWQNSSFQLFRGSQEPQKKETSEAIPEQLASVDAVVKEINAAQKQMIVQGALQSREKEWRINVSSETTLATFTDWQRLTTSVPAGYSPFAPPFNLSISAPLPLSHFPPGDNIYINRKRGGEGKRGGIGG